MKKIGLILPFSEKEIVAVEGPPYMSTSKGGFKVLKYTVCTPRYDLYVVPGINDGVLAAAATEMLGLQYEVELMIDGGFVVYPDDFYGNEYFVVAQSIYRSGKIAFFDKNLSEHIDAKYSDCRLIVIDEATRDAVAGNLFQIVFIAQLLKIPCVSVRKTMGVSRSLGQDKQAISRPFEVAELLATDK